MAIQSVLRLVTDGSAQQSAVAWRLTNALGKAWALSKILSVCLATDASYFGPVAVAGGYVRDTATERTPKDLDIFIDGGHASGPKANLIAAAVCTLLGHGAKARLIPCYGTWAPDVATIIKIEFEPEAIDQEFLWVEGIPIPFSVDIVILGREQLVKNGYTPDQEDARASFLKACIARVDTRLNALGACCTHQLCHSHWIADVLQERIVVQAARASEDLARIQTRVERLASDKYRDWKLWIETPLGELLPLHPPFPDELAPTMK